MAQITAQMVKALREKSGAGMMDCKKALQENDGDESKAMEWLRKKGLASVGKKAGRVAAEGAVGSYIHAGGKIGVMVEVNCETDFVARGEDFQTFVKEVGMHIAAAAPSYVRREEVPEEEVAKEREVFRAQVIESGKPEKIADKIVEGKIGKWYSEICLMEQGWVKDPTKMTVEDLRAELVRKTGENVQVRRFSRFVLGEGIEKKKENLAEEVAKMTQKAAESQQAPEADKATAADQAGAADQATAADQAGAADKATAADRAGVADKAAGSPKAAAKKEAEPKKPVKGAKKAGDKKSAKKKSPKKK